MKTIWKFPLPFADKITVLMPLGAEVLTAQIQFGMPYLWAVVDPDERMQVPRVFIACWTGHPLPERVGPYVGTFQLKEGALVFHLFEAAP